MNKNRDHIFVFFMSIAFFCGYSYNAEAGEIGIDDYQESTCGAQVRQGQPGLVPLYKKVITAYNDIDSEDELLRAYRQCLMAIADDLGERKINRPGTRKEVRRGTPTLFADIHFHIAITEAFLNREGQMTQSLRAAFDLVGNNNAMDHPDAIRAIVKKQPKGFLAQGWASFMRWEKMIPQHYICADNDKFVVLVNGIDSKRWKPDRPAIVQLVKQAGTMGDTPIETRYFSGQGTADELSLFLRQHRAAQPPTSRTAECRKQDEDKKQSAEANEDARKKTLKQLRKDEKAAKNNASNAAKRRDRARGKIDDLKIDIEQREADLARRIAAAEEEVARLEKEADQAEADLETANKEAENAKAKTAELNVWSGKELQ